MTSLGTRAFVGCNKLVSLIIPISLDLASNYVFDGVTSLKSVIFTPGTGVGVNYSGSYKYTPWYLSRSVLTNILLQSGISSIGSYTFYGCSSVTELELSADLTSIGHSAFYGCSSLTELEFGADLTSIGDSAFYGCSSLAELVIPDLISSIGSDTFYGCSSISLLKFGTGLTTIGSRAFLGCSSLTDLVIPDSVTSLGSYAFSKCYKLSSLTIPISLDTVTSSVYGTTSHYSIFGGVTSLKSILFTPGTGVGVDYSSSSKYQYTPWYLSKSSLTTVTLQDGITSVGPYTFSGCLSLTELTVPDSVTSLGTSAFSGCSSLKSVTIGTGVTELKSDVFNNCSNLTTLLLGDNIETISDTALINNIKLETIYFPKNLSSSVTLSVDLYDSNGYTVLESTADNLKGHWFAKNTSGNLVKDTFMLTVTVDGILKVSQTAIIGQTLEVYTIQGYTITWDSIPVEVTDGKYLMPAYHVHFVGTSAVTTYRISLDLDGGIQQDVPDGWTYTEGLYQKDFKEGVLPSFEGFNPYKTVGSVTYRFSGWSPNITLVAENKTYHAQYKTSTDGYTVVWLSDDGKVYAIDLDVVAGTTPSYKGKEPVKSADAQYTYSFTGWDTVPGPISEDTTFTAVFSRTLNSYRVVWQNYNGSVLETDDSVPYGSSPSYDSEIPVKTGTPQCTYTFSGWSPAVSVVVGNATYVAQYTETVKSYTVTWLDEDGSLLGNSYNVLYGSTPLYPNQNPAKDSTAQYTYTFSGWSPALGYVTEDVTYTAVYSVSFTTYIVTWKDDTGSMLEYDAAVDYGSIPTYNGPTPVKLSDSQYRYVFAGWSPAVEQVSGNAEYTATFTSVPNVYTVIWLNDDGSVLETDTSVAYGSTPEYNSADPVKTATDQYTYTFIGWSPSVSVVTGDVSYTAVFDSVINTYKVIWLDPQGNVLETDDSVQYGSTPAYNGSVPAKASTDEYKYTFAGWTPSVTAVTGDVSYTAVFSSEKMKYSVIWKDDSGRVLNISEVAYGSFPAYLGTDPSKESDAQYEYTFSGWSPSITAVTGTAEYTAVFTSDDVLYTVTWADEYGNILRIDSDVTYGTVPSYTGNEPTKDPTDEYTYTFSGWSPAVSKVTADITYKAVFKQETIKYTVIWKNEDGTVLQTVTDLTASMIPAYSGATPAKDPTAEYTYTFSAWDSEPSKASEVSEYRARYTASKRTYDITWKNESGEVLSIDSVPYGIVPSYSGIKLTKDSDARYIYSFSGWSPSVSEVTGVAEYTAVFSKTDVSYTVTWTDDSGNILKVDRNARYGTVPEYSDKEPSKESTSECTFAFAGWSPSVSEVTADITYQAVFSSVPVYYTVVWKNEDGTVLQTISELTASMIPSYQGSVPVKASTPEYEYTFSSWDSEPSKASEVSEYHARYTASKRTYDITWKNESGEILSIDKLIYGTVPVYSGKELSKVSDSKYQYTFAGWSPSVTAVTEDAEYTAVFSTSDVLYTVTWLNDDGSVFHIDRSAKYGEKIECPEEEPEKKSFSYFAYDFLRWSGYYDGMPVSGNHTFTAVYQEYRLLYPITFVFNDGTSTELTYKAGDATVLEPDAYINIPEGCIAYWDDYVLDCAQEKYVRVVLESYLDYISVPKGFLDTKDTGILNGNTATASVLVSGVNSNISAWYAHLGSERYIEIPETTLTGANVVGIYSINDPQANRISFGTGIQKISDNAFCGCTNLVSIETENNPYYTTVNGALLSDAGSVLRYIPAAVGESYTVPQSVKEVSAGSVTGNLKTLYFENKSCAVTLSNGCNVTGSDIELKTTDTGTDTDLSSSILKADNSELILDIETHDYFGAKTGSTVNVVLVIIAAMLVLEILALATVKTVGNRSIWIFILPMAVSGIVACMHSVMESIGSNVDMFFLAATVIWLIAALAASGMTYHTYLKANRSKGSTLLSKGGRMFLAAGPAACLIMSAAMFFAVFAGAVRTDSSAAVQIMAVSLMMFLICMFALLAQRRITKEISYAMENLN